jgi:hypothetical protein
VFQTTLTQWAFAYDVLLIWSFHNTLLDLGCYAGTDEWRPWLLWALFAGHYLFSKTIKYIPHLLRNPGDVVFLPVSVLFGFYHNTIKFRGLVTLKEVSLSNIHCSEPVNMHYFRARQYAPFLAQSNPSHLAQSNPPLQAQSLSHF